MAIKIINKKTVRKCFAKNLQEFNEITLLRELSASGSPNVLGLLESFETATDFVCVTRHFKGGSLIEWLVKSPEQPL